jgi:hypothetical protein
VEVVLTSSDDVDLVGDYSFEIVETNGNSRIVTKYEITVEESAFTFNSTAEIVEEETEEEEEEVIEQVVSLQANTTNNSN